MTRSATTAKPAARTRPTVSRSSRQPPATFAHSGAAWLCIQRPGCQGRCTCSMSSSSPPGLSTRCTSASPRSGSATVHSVNAATHGVEPLVLERQRFGAPLDHADLGCGLCRPATSAGSHRRVRLERDDLGTSGIPAKLAAAAGADLQHAAAGARGQPAPPRAHGCMLHGPHQRVVEQRRAAGWA